MDVPVKWIDRAGQRRSLDKLILDLNSSVSQTYGLRERLADQGRSEASSVASFFETSQNRSKFRATVIMLALRVVGLEE